MKQILLCILALLPALSFAQENQSFLKVGKVKHGSILIGGNLHGTYNKFSDEISSPGKRIEGSRLNGYFNAKNAYFLMNDLAVGIDLIVTHQNTKIDAETPQKPIKETYALAGPFVRYYLPVGFYGELGIASGLHNFSTGLKKSLYAGSIGVGYAHFINEKISIEPSLTFRYLTEKSEGMTNVTMGPMLGIGVQAYLLRRRAHIIKVTL